MRQLILDFVPNNVIKLEIGLELVLEIVYFYKYLHFNNLHCLSCIYKPLNDRQLFLPNLLFSFMFDELVAGFDVWTDLPTFFGALYLAF